MISAPLHSGKRPAIQSRWDSVRWDRVYVLTLVCCFWIACGEVAYILS
jgi:hypothetical protein